MVLLPLFRGLPTGAFVAGGRRALWQSPDASALAAPIYQNYQPVSSLVSNSLSWMNKCLAVCSRTKHDRDVFAQNRAGRNPF